MAENSGIEWTDNTFNPWRGCLKVSAACKNCYAEKRGDRFGEDFSGQRIILSDTGWKGPLKWNRDYEEQLSQFRGGFGEFPQRPRVFCASLADAFEDWDGPMISGGKSPVYLGKDYRASHSESARLTMSDVRRRLFELIDETPHLDWLLLTKRPENIRKMWLGQADRNQYQRPGVIRKFTRRNVWLGTTVENQEQAEKRIPELLKCRDLSPVLFLSCEPLLGPLSFQYVARERSVEDSNPGSFNDWTKLFGNWLTGSRATSMVSGIDDDPSIDWVIAGGESGPNARPSHPDWFRSLRDQCADAGVPFHFKQWGEWASVSEVAGAGVHHSFENGATVRRVGKKKAGRLLDGVEHNGTPKGCK